MFEIERKKEKENQLKDSGQMSKWGSHKKQYAFQEDK